MQRVFCVSCQRSPFIHAYSPRNKSMPFNFIKSFFSTPARNRDLSMATQTVKNYIDNNNVVVFSKTWCSYSAAAKRTLSAHKAQFTVVELDNENDGEELQDALLQLTGQRTVPNVFIGHNHIGGNSDLQALVKQGELDQLLLAAGAL